MLVSLRLAQPSSHNQGGTAPLWIVEFQYDERLCPVRCLKEYIASTGTWRKEQPQLFLELPGRHAPVSSSAIARLLKDVLNLRGVDTFCFSGHLTRSASKSTAVLLGVAIMQRAGQFSRFYHKPTEGESKAAQFSNAVLLCKYYKHAYRDMLIDQNPLKYNYRMAKGSIAACYSELYEGDERRSTCPFLTHPPLYIKWKEGVGTDQGEKDKQDLDRSFGRITRLLQRMTSFQQLFLELR